MSIGLQLRHEPGRHVDVSTNRGMLLWRYVYAPETPSNEARRPYAQFPDIEASEIFALSPVVHGELRGVPNRLHLPDRLILHVAAR